MKNYKFQLNLRFFNSCLEVQIIFLLMPFQHLVDLLGEPELCASPNSCVLLCCFVFQFVLDRQLVDLVLEVAELAALQQDRAFL